MEKRRKIIWIILGLLLIFVLFKLYFYILEPSYVSYAVECFGKTEADYGYYQGGSTTIDYNNSNLTIQINQMLSEKVKAIVWKHECVHVNQIMRYKKATCLNLFFLENEAYIMEYSPDWIYNKLYDTSLC